LLPLLVSASTVEKDLADDARETGKAWEFPEPLGRQE
jgi:hypothetical protein